MERKANSSAQSRSLRCCHGRVEHSRKNPTLSSGLNPDAIRSGFWKGIRKRDFSSSANSIRVALVKPWSERWLVQR